MQTSAMIARLIKFHGNSPFCYFLVVGMKTDQPINRQRMLTGERCMAIDRKIRFTEADIKLFTKVQT